MKFEKISDFTDTIKDEKDPSFEVIENKKPESDQDRRVARLQQRLEVEEKIRQASKEAISDIIKAATTTPELVPSFINAHIEDIRKTVGTPREQVLKSLSNSAEQETEHLEIQLKGAQTSEEVRVGHLKRLEKKISKGEADESDIKDFEFTKKQIDEAKKEIYEIQKGVDAAHSVLNKLMPEVSDRAV